MAQTMNTLGGLSVENQEFYNKVLLKRLTKELVFTKFAQKKPAPKNEGDTTNFRRFSSLPVNTTPLTEGVTPAGQSLAVTTVKATVKQYGDYVMITDILELMAKDPVLTETAQLLGEQAAEVIDTVVRDVIVSGTNVQYAGGKTARNLVTATDLLTSLEIRKAVRTLRKCNVKPLEGGFYVGIIGPDAEFDLMSDSAWQDVSKYAASTQIFKGEIGKLFGVRFVRTTNDKILTGAGASSIDLNTTLIIGKDAYGVVDIEGSSAPKNIIKPKGSAGTDDPLDQRQTSGWKALFTAVRLEELAILRIEHASSK